MKVWLRDGLDLLYPRSCIGCGQANPECWPHLCWECRSRLTTVQPPFCSCCGDPVSGFIDHSYRCSWCKKNKPAFDVARSCARYDGLVRELLLLLKYRGGVCYAEDLAELLVAGVQRYYADRSFDAVVPVPLHPLRRLQRNYNQAKLLSSSLARRIGLPLHTNCIRRVKRTDTQTKLTAAQRLSNVNKAFRAGHLSWLANRRVLLIDDVMTTGATVASCARALKKGGAESVSVLTVARG